MVVCKNVGRFEVRELIFVEGFGFFRRERSRRRWRPKGRGRGVLRLAPALYVPSETKTKNRANIIINNTSMQWK